jgi:site-specific DNA-cytosine methylase
MAQDDSSTTGASPTIKVVDLFCGAGGLAFGLKTAGLTIAAGVDLDGSCQHAFEANCGGSFSKKSVSDLTGSELNNWFEGALRASGMGRVRRGTQRKEISGLVDRG